MLNGHETCEEGELDGIKFKIHKPGIKLDTDKSRFDLIPPEALFALSEILTLGEKKYSGRNWEQGMDWGRVFAGIMRHLWAWWGGQDKDPETRRSHLWHALAGITFLTTYEARSVGTDSRFKTLSDKPMGICELP